MDVVYSILTFISPSAIHTMSNDWWQPTASTSSAYLSTPTRQTASGPARPLQASSNQPSTALGHSFGPGPGSGPSPAVGAAGSHHDEFDDELSAEDVRIAEGLRFGNGTTGTGTGGGGGFANSPIAARTTGYMGSPGASGSPAGYGGGYSGSPLAGVPGIGSPAGRRSPGGRFGAGDKYVYVSEVGVGLGIWERRYWGCWRSWTYGYGQGTWWGCMRVTIELTR